MTVFKSLGLVALACVVLQGQPSVEDPVMKVRAQRAQAQGLSEGDLPPVPKGVIEPPPLPPPELHVRDMARTSGQKSRLSRASRKMARRGKVVQAETKVTKSKAKTKTKVKAQAAPKQPKARKKRGRR